jgi:signal transduction histidine kinase
MHQGINLNAVALSEKAANKTQQRTVALVCVAYAAAAAALLPFVATEWPAVPSFAGIYATGVLVADLCTYVLLTAQFRAGGPRWLLLLSTAYLFSGVMAVLHIATFPGALLPEQALIGGTKTVGWLYAVWSLGFIGLLLLAIAGVTRSRAPAHNPGSEATLAASAVFATAGAIALGLIYFDPVLPAPVVGERFSSWSIAVNYLRGALAALALFVIWRTPRRQRLIVLWLSLVLVAAALGPVLTDLGGRRYTFGWYAGRVSFLLASYVLLAVLVSEFVKMQHALAAAVVRLGKQTEDLTAEVKRRQAVERRLVQSERMNAIGQLASGVAHDFNNLLTAVIANLEIILRTTPDPRVRTTAESAKHAALRGARLTKSLLAFGRQQHLYKKSVRVEEIVNDSLLLLQRAAGPGIEIKLGVSETTWDCETDPAQLEVALLNLVTNARDAMRDGGSIFIASRNVTDRRRKSGSKRLEADSRDYVELSVRDTGSGIPLELQHRIFEPFFTTKDVSLGTGLGLSQVQGFARQSGGDVAIDSVEGRGTTVRLYLPRARTAPPRTVATAVADAAENG